MKQTFSEDQEGAIDYLVLCGRNEGDAYRDNKNAERAVQMVLEENRRINAHQLRKPDGGGRMYIGKRIQAEAARRIRELWNQE